MNLNQDILSLVLTHLGCDEIVKCNNTKTSSENFFLLRFNQKYMKLTLSMSEMYLLENVKSGRDIFKKIETEVFEFLLTGKNDITNEILKTDSRSL